MNTEPSQATKPEIEYIPPSVEQLLVFAFRVHKQLSATTEDNAADENEAVANLASFLHLMGRLEAKHLNFGRQDAKSTN